VPAHPESSRVLFVWLVPAALGSLRNAFNLVCNTVGHALPATVFLDVVVLNSAPELLGPLERARTLFVERDAGERAAALRAAAAEAGEERPAPRRRR